MQTTGIHSSSRLTPFIIVNAVLRIAESIGSADASVERRRSFSEILSQIIENFSAAKKEKFWKIKKKCPIISLMNAKMPLTEELLKAKCKHATRARNFFRLCTSQLCSVFLINWNSISTSGHVEFRFFPVSSWTEIHFSQKKQFIINFIEYVEDTPPFQLH